MGIIIAAILANTNNPKPPQGKTGQQKRSALRDPIVWATIGIFLATAAAVGVAILQWLTLEKTDGTLKETLSANKAIQRAFVFQKSVWYRPFIKNGNRVWRGLVEWENSGVTPTKISNFELACPSVPSIPGMRMAVNPYALKKDPFTPKDKIIRVSTILGPKQPKFGGQCEFTGDELVRAQNGTATQYIIAQVTYEDIFDSPHITRFCEYIYHIDGNLSGPQVEVSGGPCVRHNCADEQCANEDAEPDLPPEKLLPQK